MKKQTYVIWSNMIARCHNPNNPTYRYYGGKGLIVCESWQKYENFIKDIGERPSKEYFLMRKDKEKGYSPENCEWSKRADYSKKLTYMGETHSIAEWAIKIGIKERTLRNRIMSGWTLEQIMIRPVNKKEKSTLYSVRVRAKTKEKRVNQIVLSEKTFEACWNYTRECISRCQEKKIEATLIIEETETRQIMVEMKVHVTVEEEELPSTGEVDQEGNEGEN